MQKRAALKKNTAINLDDFPLLDIVKAYPLSNYALAVEFEDGLHGIIEMKNLITSKRRTVFSILKNKKIFDSVEIQHGTVCWVDPNQFDIRGDAAFPHIYADLAPDTIYKQLRSKPVYVIK